jgi:hypothetical protein
MENKPKVFGMTASPVVRKGKRTCCGIMEGLKFSNCLSV